PCDFPPVCSYILFYQVASPGQEKLRIKNLFYFIKSLLQVGLYVIYVFNTKRNSQHGWFNTRLQLLLISKLLMSRRCWVYNQCLRVTHIGQMTYQFKVVHQFLCLFLSTFYFKGKHTTKTSFQILLGPVMIFARWQTWVVHTFYIFMCFEPLCQCKSILHCSVHP